MGFMRWLIMYGYDLGMSCRLRLDGPGDYESADQVGPGLGFVCQLIGWGRVSARADQVGPGFVCGLIEKGRASARADQVGPGLVCGPIE